MQIVMKVLLVEARTSLLTGATIAIGTILGYSAMAGCVGGGGLGDLAIRYGYQRFRPEVMAIAVVVILLMVELIQFAGTFVSRRISARR